MTRRRKSLMHMSLDAMRAAQDAAVTISARLPDLAKASRDPSAPPSAEMQRMVSEKVNAAMQGGVAAGFAMGDFWTKALFGRLKTPMDMAHGLATVADAAMRPARKKVRENAKRLTGRDK